MKIRVQRAGVRCRETSNHLGYRFVALEPRPTLTFSEPHGLRPGQEKLDRRMSSSHLSPLLTTPVRRAAARGCSRLSLDRRRRCGNVEIARLGFWRDCQARWEAWKSPGLPPRPLSPSAGLFHAFHGASFPQRVSHSPVHLSTPGLGTDRFCGGTGLVATNAGRKSSSFHEVNR